MYSHVLKQSIHVFLRKLEYTRETLIAFKKEMAEKASSKKGGQEAGGFGGFGGFGGGGGGGGADKKSVSLYKKFDILFYFSTV